MALDKITIFELHFDDAKFGPSFSSDDEDSEEGTTVEIEGDEYDDYEAVSGGRPGIGKALFVAGVAFGISYALRRFLGSGDDEYELVDVVDEGEEMESEAAN